LPDECHLLLEEDGFESAQIGGVDEIAEREGTQFEEVELITVEQDPAGQDLPAEQRVRLGEEDNVERLAIEDGPEGAMDVPDGLPIAPGEERYGKVDVAVRPGCRDAGCVRSEEDDTTQTQPLAFCRKGFGVVFQRSGRAVQV
jgi:hypothetical protein